MSTVPSATDLSGADAMKAGTRWLLKGVLSHKRARRELAECCARVFAADAKGNWWTNTQAALGLLMEVQGIVLLAAVS